MSNAVVLHIQLGSAGNVDRSSKRAGRIGSIDSFIGGLE
jgi:hypothetical protein